MSAVVDDRNHLKRELIRSHKFKMGLDCDKAEEDFIIAAQNLPHYGGHFYTASWVTISTSFSSCIFFYFVIRVKMSDF